MWYGRIERYTLIIWDTSRKPATIVRSDELADALKANGCKKLRAANLSRLAVAGSAAEVRRRLERMAAFDAFETTETAALGLDTKAADTLNAMTLATIAFRAEVELMSSRIAAGMAAAAAGDYVDQAILGDGTILTAYAALYNAPNAQSAAAPAPVGPVVVANLPAFARHYGRWSEPVLNPPTALQTQRAQAWCAAWGIVLGVPVGGALYPLTNGCVPALQQLDSTDSCCSSLRCS